jgi:dTDP-4-dehydrorhamnose reductase
MKVLLLGKNGQIGWELQRTLAPLGEIIALDVPEITLENPDSIRSCLRTHRPELVVNAAAYTAVDKAEEEPDLAMAVNGTAPGILAEEAKRLGAALIHYSTDHVFDGEKKTPYLESDLPNPRNVYGKTKLAGEKAIQAVSVPHLIFRTSWVYGLRGQNFLRTILRLAGEREEIKVVDDQIGAPTWCRMIAEATAQVIAEVVTPLSKKSLKDVNVLYHLTAGGETSWFHFAKVITELDPRRSEQALKRLLKTTTSDYRTPAQRPLNSRLDCTAIKGMYVIALPDWKTSLQQVMQDLLQD